MTGFGPTACARRYLYDEDGTSLLGEYSQASAGAPVVALYEVVYLAGTPVLALAGGQVYSVQADHLNAPRTIKNSAGAVMWRWQSDAFGVGQADSNPSGLFAFEFNLRFPGQLFDAETGLHYNNARYYDPATGRYISSDPIGLAGGINIYGYVGQAPTGAVDPTGLAELNYFNPVVEPNLTFSAHRLHVPGVFVWASHGIPGQVEVTIDGTTSLWDAPRIAAAIEAHPEYHGQDVLLAACHSGYGANPLNQQVADLLGVNVGGYQDYAWFDTTFLSRTVDVPYSQAAKRIKGELVKYGSKTKIVWAAPPKRVKSCRQLNAFYSQ